MSDSYYVEEEIDDTFYNEKGNLEKLQKIIPSRFIVVDNFLVDLLKLTYDFDFQYMEYPGSKMLRGRDSSENTGIILTTVTDGIEGLSLTITSKDKQDEKYILGIL